MSEFREDLEAIRVMGLWRFLYSRFAYRAHMRFIHSRGKHSMKTLHPMGGPEFKRCDWCGHTEWPHVET